MRPAGSRIGANVAVGASVSLGEATPHTQIPSSVSAITAESPTTTCEMYPASTKPSGSCSQSTPSTEIQATATEPKSFAAVEIPPVASRPAPTSTTASIPPSKPVPPGSPSQLNPSADVHTAVPNPSFPGCNVPPTATRPGPPTAISASPSVKPSGTDARAHVTSSCGT